MIIDLRLWIDDDSKAIILNPQSIINFFMIKNILLTLLVIGGSAGFFLWGKYQAVSSPNVPSDLKEIFVEIPTNSTFSEVVDILFKNGQITDTVSFRQVAEWMSYKKPKMRAGRFKLQSNWSNRELIGHLRAGKQSPVKVVFNTGRFAHDVAGKAARTIEADSIDIAKLFNNTNFIKGHNYSSETLISLFIPNTYEFFWNTDAKGFFEKMVKEHKRFWEKNDREKKAAKLKMSKEEVYTLASIVERETNRNDEKKRMAGVYLNRLRKGIPLQADPTAVFATRDFGARRVLNKHINFDSPYNTYKYAGLPPGPISLASIPSIDAVLNSESHDYLYFCAKPDYSGYHAFAKTLAGHNRNANKYRSWLSKELKK